MAGAAGSTVFAPEASITVASRLPVQGLPARPGLQSQTVSSGTADGAIEAGAIEANGG